MLPVGILHSQIQRLTTKLRSGNVHRSISLFYLLKNENNQNEEDLESNPYYEKYADKIKLAQTNAEKHEAPRTPRDSSLRRETEKWKKNIEMVEEQLTEKKKSQEDRRGSKLPSTLNEVLHLDLLDSKTTEEVTHIWMEHFKGKESVSAVIPSDVFDEMTKQIETCPTFLYPLPKSQGYEFVLSQFERNRCFFTSLINFQVHGENAPWQLCMTFYKELKDTKDVVLMTSELDTTSMNVMEAQCLAHLQKIFYVNPTEKRLSLLECFNNTPDAFKYMDLVKEVEESNMVVKGLS